MTQHIYVVQTNAVAGQEAEFNDWYTNEHIHDVVSIDGWTAAQRFRLNEVGQSINTYPYTYLAVYEMENDDVRGNLRRLNERMRSARISPAMAPRPSARVFTSITERVVKP
jgi:hypothetical protein